MEKLKVVQIGTEHDHAAVVLDSLRRQSDIFDIVGYVVPEDDATEQYGSSVWALKGLGRLTIEEALAIPGLQGAVIETSEKLLTKYARIAAERGLAVHMDKPGGDEGEPYQDLIRYLKEHGNVFSLGYMYRFNPAVQKVMEMHKNGSLGERNRRRGGSRAGRKGDGRLGGILPHLQRRRPQPRPVRYGT